MDSGAVLHVLDKAVSSADVPVVFRPCKGSKIQLLVQKYADYDPNNNSCIQSLGMCRPWSYEDYLARILTFRNPSVWFAKPDELSPLECALYGWRISGPNTLLCSTCGRTIEHDVAGDPAGKLLLEHLSKGHAPDCGWGKDGQSCDRAFKEIPGLHSDRALAVQLIKRAQGLFEALVASGCAVEAFREANTNVGSSAGEGHSSPAQFRVSEGESGSGTVKIRQCLGASHRWVSSSEAGVADTTGDKSCNDSLARVAAATSILLDRTAAQPQSQPQQEDWEGRAGLQAALMLAAAGWEVPAAKTDAPQRTSGGCDLFCALCTRTLRLRPSTKEHCTNTNTSTNTSTSTSGNEQSSGLLGGGEALNVEWLRGHRHFCPYVTAPSQRPAWLSPPVGGKGPAGAGAASHTGWQLCLQAIVQVLPQKQGTEVRVAAGEKGKDHPLNVEGGEVSPEQSYKRIRAVLDAAAVPPLQPTKR